MRLLPCRRAMMPQPSRVATCCIHTIHLSQNRVRKELCQSSSCARVRASEHNFASYTGELGGDARLEHGEERPAKTSKVCRVQLTKEVDPQDGIDGYHDHNDHEGLHHRQDGGDDSVHEHAQRGEPRKNTQNAEGAEKAKGFERGRG